MTKAMTPSANLRTGLLRQMSHSGGMGDVVYACAAIKQMRVPVELHLCTLWTGAHDRCASLKALLELQPYLSGVEISGDVVGFNLDVWRKHRVQGLNIPEIICDWLHLPRPDHRSPWLTCPESKPIAPVVVHRSFRYRNLDFPWPRIVERYRRQLVFVSVEREEYDDFADRFGKVDYYCPRDYLETAMILQGAKLVICNQSSPGAVAEGLKRPKILEAVRSGLWAADCRWQRANCQTVEGADVQLPEL